MKFWIKMIAGLVMGIIIGSYIAPTSVTLEPLRVIGMLFFRLLNFFVMPLLLFSGIRSVLSLRKHQSLFIVLIKSLGFYIGLTVVGATIGMMLGDVLKPGVGTNIREFVSPIVIDYPQTSRFILDIVPDSFFALIRSGYAVLGLLFVSYIVASGIILAKDDAEEFLSLIVSIDNTLHRLNCIILEFLPIGIFTYVGYLLGSVTGQSVLPYLKLILIIIAGSVIQIIIVESLLVFFITKLNPFKFIHAVIPGAVAGFVSGSSYTAYPVLVENMEHNLGAERGIFSFVAGVGTAFSFSGSALAAGVSTLFVAQAYGLDLSAYLQIIIILLISLASIKMDGSKKGGLVLLSVVLSHIVKLPAEGYALILGVTAIIEQIETVVNIIGTAAVSYIISYSEGAVKNVATRDFV